MTEGKSSYFDLDCTSSAFQIRVNWSETYDASTNSSTVTVESVQFKSTGYRRFTYYPDGVVKINGITVLTMNSNFGDHYCRADSLDTWSSIINSSSNTVATGSTTVIHDADGTKSITIEVAGNRFSQCYFYLASGGDGGGNGWGCAGYNTVTLTTIPTYYLDISAGEGSSIVVNRTVSGYANTGIISAGERLYYGDNLKITFSPAVNHKLLTTEVNNSGFTSGNTHTVTENVYVSSTAQILASDVGATNADIGSVSTITVTKYSNTYYHSLQYSFGDISGYITRSGGVQASEEKFSDTNVPFTVPTAFYEQIPNDHTGICTITCRTYSSASSTTVLGNATTCTFVVTAAYSTCAPLVSASVVDINDVTKALTGDEKKLIRYKSTALCTIEATWLRHSTVGALSIAGNAVQGNIVGDVSTATKKFVNSDRSSFVFSATDSRGYTTQTAVHPTIVAYVNLTCNPIITRMEPTGNTMTISLSGNVYRGSFGAYSNTLTLKYRYKAEDGSYSEWKVMDLTNIIFGASTYYSNKPIELTDKFDYQKAYEFQIQATDGTSEHVLSTVISTVSVQRGIPVFDWGEDDFAFHVPVKIDGDLHVTGSLAVNGENVAPDGDVTDIPKAELEFVVEKDIQDRNSVCVVEETGADVSAADNSAYFDKTHLVVQKDTYKLDKDTILSLQNKKLVGNGSVAWKDWDNIAQGWKDTFDPTMLSGALKVRYADDPVYLSMRLPSEANFETDYITRPGMRASDYAAANLVTVNNIGAIYPIDYTQLPDEIVICIGNLSLYTLSKEPNARWKLHDKCSIPAGYAMYALPWNTSHDANVRLDDSKVSVCDGYMRFTLSRDDFAPMSSVAGSLAKTLHFWGNHNELDLMNNAAVITFYEVWVETPAAVGNLYVAPGCDRKNSDSSIISQNFWGRNVLLSTAKKVITGHNISDSLYEALRDTPNDTRLVYADYASVCGSSYDVKLLQDKLEKDLADKSVKLDACFSTLEITEVTTPGININPGSYETGTILRTDGNIGVEHNGWCPNIRTKGYIKVEGGRTIVLYYESAEWNSNDIGVSFYIFEYDIAKNLIRRTDLGSSEFYFRPYVNNNASYTLSQNTAYIRIVYENWASGAPDIPLDEVKAAVYYIENARKAFVEYYADIEAVYGVKGDRVILTAPNGAQFALSVGNDGTLNTNLIT